MAAATSQTTLSRVPTRGRTTIAYANQSPIVVLAREPPSRPEKLHGPGAPTNTKPKTNTIKQIASDLAGGLRLRVGRMAGV